MRKNQKRWPLLGKKVPSSGPKGAFFRAKKRHLFSMYILSRAYARTLKFYQRKICTSVTDRCKPLQDNEIDRCRFGDNSDRYAGNWH